jgi:hypothetical protein
VDDEELNVCVKVPTAIANFAISDIFSVLFICPGRQELSVLACTAWGWADREDELELDSALLLILTIARVFGVHWEMPFFLLDKLNSLKHGVMKLEHGF